MTRFAKALESAHGLRCLEIDQRVASDATTDLQNSQRPTPEGQVPQSSDRGISAGDRATGSASSVQSTSNQAAHTSSSGSSPTDYKANLSEDTNATVDDPPAQPSRTGETANYAAMQKKRQQEAKEERARILALVESDKTRRRKDAERKVNNVDQSNEESAPPRGKGSSAPAPAPKGQDCALQIRLFDGSSIRSRFPNASTLSGNVRKVT